jgi:hypothetical protein
MAALPKACVACEHGVPKRGRRRCPLCPRVFRSGWEGVDAHWRARHEAELPYRKFWSSLCRAHRAGRSLECPSCRKRIPRGRQWPRQCPECARVFQGRGWSGIESHWRAEHGDVMSYEDFLASLCPAHRGSADPATGYLPL